MMIGTTNQFFFASIVSHISQNGTQKSTTIGARKQKKEMW